MLHVHDLVDFVSGEAEIAGKSAADYINGNLAKECEIPVETDGKVRYSVPQKITAYKDCEVYFRVADVYKNATLKVVCNGETVFTKKKPKMAPGEMEKVLIKKDWLSGTDRIRLELEVQ